MVIFIVGSLFLSSAAFFIIGLANNSGAPPAVEPLTAFVLEKALSEESEKFYVGNGFTIMRVYYSGDNGTLSNYVSGLPDAMATVSGQKQLIVEKIPANETYVTVESLNGKDVVNGTDAQKISDALCDKLMLKPSVCLFRNFTASS